MQVTKTINDIVNITFNPSADAISLLDFVLVEDMDKRFLGQIVELTNDRYDLSLNLAKIKIFYEINKDNEIVTYSGYTPTRLCSVTLCNQKEIEAFINIDKTLFQVGNNPKTMLPLDFNLEFFENKPLILADRLDDLHVLTDNLSQKLSDFKHVVVFDYTGSLNVRNAKRLVATKDFKMPLDYYSLDYVWDEALYGASMETQAVLEEIFNAVKEYAKELGENSFIPFKQFLTVIHRQYKETPIKELLVLKNRLIKYQQSKIFAQGIKEVNIVNKTVDAEKITVIDLSQLGVIWHREFISFILRTLKTPSFVFLRFNDTNFDQNLINKIYGKNNGIITIPSVSYGYKRLPVMLENTKNYIFLPSLNNRRNFVCADCAIWNLNQNYALLWGEDSKNFVFQMQNTITIDENIKKEEVKKIRLDELNKYSSIALEEEKESDLEIVGKNLYNDLNEDKKENQEPRKTNVNFAKDDYSKDETEALNKADEEKKEDELKKLIDNLEEEPQNKIPVLEKQTVTQKFPKLKKQEVIQKQKEIKEEKPIPQEKTDTNSQETEVKENQQVISEDELEFFDNFENEVKVLPNKPIQEENIIKEENTKEANEIEIIQDNKENSIPQESTLQEAIISDVIPQEEVLQEETQTPEMQELEIAKAVPETIPSKAPGDLNKDLDDAFDKIIENETPPSMLDNPQEIVINENTKINVEEIKNEETPDIPVYQPEEPQGTGDDDLQEGDRVIHEKYGLGKILKTVNYSNRSLFQIEFENIGKRLLDPKIAGIKKA